MVCVLVKREEFSWTMFHILLFFIMRYKGDVFNLFSKIGFIKCLIHGKFIQLLKLIQGKTLW